MWWRLTRGEAGSVGGMYVTYLFAHIELRAGEVQKFTEMFGVLAPLIARNKFRL